MDTIHDPSSKTHVDNSSCLAPFGVVSTTVKTIVLLGGSLAKFDKVKEHVQSLCISVVEVVHIHNPVRTILENCSRKLSLPVVPGVSLDEICVGRDILGVIPLVDSLVPTADHWNSVLNIPGNDVSTSLCRCDKERMQSSLKLAGLSYCESVRVSTIGEALFHWVSTFNSGQVILKPVQSGGSDGVVLCTTKIHICRYMKKYLNVLMQYMVLY